MPLHEERNRLSWNAATVAHNAHKGDQAAFFRGGGSTLFPEEIGLLGDVTGRSLLHAQCNSGQDTLSLAALGADVTGVDISDEAIRFAADLSNQTGIPARFERAEVVAWMHAAEGRYDIVFASYGVLWWLPDLDAWARGAARVLRPGGRLVLMEFHPVALALDDSGSPTGNYFESLPIETTEGVGDYVGLSGEGLGAVTPVATPFVNPHPSVGFQWGLGQIVSALARAGLRIEVLEEFPFTNGWRPFEGMEQRPGRRMYLPGPSALPLMFGLCASKA
ncbi:class I SAM-dependent methyltransferase [Seohaeicola nanhaiensis]|uniref:Class I SAM-dependent methyltransferase n=1 Tax=Seohaeicola nanhaiensis TaxID=1387282 RepID=A0ABV9KHG7_9RHOB